MKTRANYVHDKLSDLYIGFALVSFGSIGFPIFTNQSQVDFNTVIMGFMIGLALIVMSLLHALKI